MKIDNDSSAADHVIGDCLSNSVVRKLLFITFSDYVANPILCFLIIAGYEANIAAFFLS